MSKSISKNASKSTSKSQTSTDSDLLQQVLKSKNLPEGVAETEGLNGSTVNPLYSHRTMRCYSITESEIHQIGLSNIATTAFFGVGSALMAFGVDIFKDTLLTPEVPIQAKILTGYVQPLCVIFGLAFWILAGVSLWWRRDMFKIIKKESGEI